MSSALVVTTILASTVAATLIDWLLQGVLTVQLYLYYLAFPNDRTWIKVAVYTVYIIETIQVIGLGVLLILITVSGSHYPPTFIFASDVASHEYTWAAQALLVRLVAGMTPLIAQCIYAHRIRMITQGIVIPCLIIALATLQLFAAILNMVTPASTSTIVHALWIGLNVINDLIITVVMVRSLSKEKPLSNYTRSKVMRLVRLIIATGSLTVVANILALILLFIDAYVIRGWIGTTAIVFTPKLYANSILVMLNSRLTVRNSQDVKPSNMISVNALSTLVIADHQVGPSDSAMVYDEIVSSTSAARSPIQVAVLPR